MFQLFLTSCFLFFAQSVWAEARQEQRFQKPIQDLFQSLRRKNPDDVVNELIAKGNRADLFELEALLRVYEDEYPETLAGFLEEDIKPLEDEIGKWLEVREAIEFSKKMKAPKQVVIYLKGREELAREKLKKYLEEKKFIGKDFEASPLQKLMDAVQETDWSGKKTDRKLVLKALRNVLKEVDKTPYDLKLLEEGVHELRRDLRWVPIFLRSFNDLFKLDERKLSKVKLDPQDPVFDSPYSKIPQARDSVSFPILFPKLGMLALNKVIEGLGQAKDIGKMESYLAHVLLQSGAAQTKTEAKAFAKDLVRKHPDYVPVYQKAGTLYRYLTDENRGLIPALRDVLREQKDWKKQDCQAFLKSLKAPTR